MAYPLLISTIFEFHERTARLLSRQVRATLQKLKDGGATHTRTCSTWDNAMDLHPFKRVASGDFDLDKENPTWDEAAKEFVGYSEEVGIGNVRTPFDQCGQNPRFNCNIFGKNIQRLQGITDYSDKAKPYHYRWIDRNLAIFKAKRCVVELFNEVSFEDWRTASHANEWAQAQVVPFWKYILARNGNRPIMFSAQEPRAWDPPYTGDTDGTASRILGNLSEAGIPGDKIIYSIHGLGSAENWQRLMALRHKGGSIISGRPKIVVCDDGVDTQSFNRVPPDRRGACETADFKRCCWDRAGRLEMLQAAKTDRPGQVVGVDWLPREISMQHRNPNTILIPLSCSIYKAAHLILT